MYKPKLLCVNETKILSNESEQVIKHLEKYFTQSFFNCSPGRKNYAGVAIFASAEMPILRQLPGMEGDTEGRVVACELDKCLVVSVYTPHSGVGELKRLEYRVEEWDRLFSKYLNQL